MATLPAPVTAPAQLPGIQLVARGGVGGRTPPALLAAGELALTLTFSGWGLLLAGGLSDATSTAVAPGAISSSAAWGSLGAAAAVCLTERLTFEAALGARLVVLSVSASGFSENKSVTLLSGGGFAEAGLSFRLVGPLVVGLWGTASVRSSEERLFVSNVEGTVLVPRWQLGLFAGMGVQWR